MLNHTARTRIGFAAAMCCLMPGIFSPVPAAAQFDVSDSFGGFDNDIQVDGGFDVPVIDVPAETLKPATWSFVVDTTVDAGDANPGDGVCEAKVDGNERCTLRAAVEEANAADERPQIWLPDLGGGYELELGALVIERPMSIRGIDTPFISSLGTHRVFDVNSGSSGFTEIFDMTVMDGDEPEGSGGNVLVRDYSRARLFGLTVIEGNARVGGGIAVTDGAIAIIEDSNIRWNSTENLGAARWSSGGGLAVDDFSDVVVRRSTIAENVASYGGGIFVSNGSLAVYDSEIHDNESEFYGGGVGVIADGVASFVRTQITGNSAGHHDDPNRLRNRPRVGGGIFVHSIYVSIEATTIVGNGVARPGTLYWSPDCHTVLTNAVDHLLTLVGSENVIGDMGNSCEVRQA